MSQTVTIEEFQAMQARVAALEKSHNKTLELVEDALTREALARAKAEDDGARIPGAAVAAIIDGAHPITAIRKARGMTQEQLAELADTSKVYISSIERRERNAGRDLEARLAKALDVQPAALRED